MSPKAEYYVSASRQASEAAREEMESSKVNWLKLPVGDTLVRILPPHRAMQNKDTGAAPFYHHVSLHFKVGPNKRVVVCPRKMTGGALHCPVCDFAFQLKDGGQDRAGNDLLPGWQAYMNVLVIDPKTGEPVRNKAGELEVFVWSAGRGTLDKIFGQVERREKKLKKAIDITDPDEGFVLEVGRKGTEKEDTKYEVFLADEPSSIMDYVDEWGPGLVDVTQLNTLRPAEELRTLLTGGSSEDPFAGKSEALPAGKKNLSFSDRSEDAVDAEYREVDETPDEEEGDDTSSDSAADRLRRLVDAKK